MILLFSWCTYSFAHREPNTLGIVGTRGAGINVGTTLLELADDSLVVLLAVNVTEEIAVNVVLAFAEVAIRSNHYASVTINHAMIQFDVLLQSPFVVFVATRRYLLCQLCLLSKEFGFFFRRALTKQMVGIDG